MILEIRVYYYESGDKYMWNYKNSKLFSYVIINMPKMMYSHPNEKTVWGVLVKKKKLITDFNKTF